ncbi:hypothetical protein GCM10007315_15660 [Gemmobacter tilapiae]|uniref:DUF1778 domain-containing protein n=2 Tax=Neogemmobacter tilapiae TaxID=875041 RepID=A0A918TLX1_9RHOB|nr:hypothetical protein GCM10007315_15660 [Gemmobacter tilapiae]
MASALELSGILPYISDVEAVMTQTKTRSERIEARTTADTLAIVRRAAEIQGRSISEFVMSAAEEAARKAVEDDRLIRLTEAEQARFVEALLNPKAPAPAMQRAFEHRRRLTGGL